MNNIYDIDFLIERANADRARIKFIEIYNGFLTQKDKGALFQRIDKVSGSNDFGTALEFFKAKCQGDFTARFSPSGEVIWFTNLASANTQPSNTFFPGAYTGGQLQGAASYPTNANGSINVQELLRNYLDLMQKHNDLKTKHDLLTEKNEQLQGAEHKFGYIVEKFFHNLNNRSTSMNGSRIDPQPQPQQQPLQGSQTTEEDMSELENSLTILVQLLGEDGIHSAAKKLQSDPAALSFLLNYLKS